MSVIGTVVTHTSAPNNNRDDSFALRLRGTMASISMATNSNKIEAENVGFMVAVHEPANLALAAVGLVGWSAYARRRRRISSK